MSLWIFNSPGTATAQAWDKQVPPEDAGREPGKENSKETPGEKVTLVRDSQFFYRRTGLASCEWNDV